MYSKMPTDAQIASLLLAFTLPTPTGLPGTMTPMLVVLFSWASAPDQAAVRIPGLAWSYA